MVAWTGARSMSLKQITARVLLALIGSGFLTMMVGGAIGGWAASQKFEAVAGVRLDYLEAFQVDSRAEAKELGVRVDSVQVRQIRIQANDKLVNYKLDQLLLAQGIPLIPERGANDIR